MSWLGFGGDEEEEEEEIDLNDPMVKKMIVEIHGGRDITDATTRHSKKGPQFCNVFCTIKFLQRKEETEIIERSMNPIWDVKYVYPLEGVNENSILEIQVFHSGTISNTFLGEIRVPVSEHMVSYELAVLHWFPLQNIKLKKKDGSPGELGVRIGIQGGYVNQSSGFDDDMDDRTAEEIYEEAVAVAQDANASAYRSLRLAEKTLEINVGTAGRLREQGNQIERMQNDMDTLHNNMKQSERKLRSIESVWGSVANTVTSSKNKRYKKKAHQDRVILKNRKKEEKKIMKAREKEYEITRLQDKQRSKQRDFMIESVTSGRRFEAGSQEELFYNTVDDTNVVVDKISGVLDDIKAVTLDIGLEINEHNQRLDALAYDVNKAAPRMDSAIKRSRAIVKG